MNKKKETVKEKEDNQKRNDLFKNKLNETLNENEEVLDFFGSEKGQTNKQPKL